ncbi:MAG: histidine phosphatase family protein [Burkholderiaceae bacterium]
MAGGTMLATPGLSLLAQATLEVLDPRQAAARLARRGHVLLMRHAQTVAGTGDPPGFRLDDCATQRNLSDQGRAQARAIGEALRAAAIVPVKVQSSAWCRCRETAELAFGDYTVLPALNSFFEDRSSAPAQLEALREAGRRVPVQDTIVWVTHQVVISALAGRFTSQGEILAVPAGDADWTPAFSIRA